jgi:hypothetical protein
MSTLNQVHRQQPEALPGPYNDEPGEQLEVKPVVLNLVRSQIRALLESSPSYRQISTEERKKIANNLVKIAAYNAALIHDDWNVSEKYLGQRPLVREQKMLEGVETGNNMRAPARTAEDEGSRRPADEFAPRAARNVAQITEDTLNAIAFPTFVSDLIQGSFQAIVDASIQQMEAFGELLANVAKTVDEFMADNITDNQARDWLAGAYPQVIRLDTSSGNPKLVTAENADEAVAPNFKNDLNVEEDVGVDEDAFETILVPAARRRLAQNRQQVLATMVLMGINRIVVTSGKIRATMGFRIDTTDRGRAESASQFDTKTEAKGRYGHFFTPYSMSVKTSVAYVSSSKKDSESEINVAADLTGEIDLKFKSETFPLERFADQGVLSSIQSNTPNPAANKPITGNVAEGA